MSLSDAVKAASEKQQETVAEKNKETLIEINSAIFGKAQTYMNVIMLAGYAGIFTMWNFTRKYLSQDVEVTTAALVGISVFAFVTFEIYKLLVTSKQAMELQKVLKGTLTPQQFFDACDKYHRFADRASVALLKVWAPFFVVAALTGYAAGMILIGNFFWILYNGALN